MSSNLRRMEADLSKLIAAHLSNLEATLRAKTIERVAARAAPELGYEPPKTPVLLAALLRIAEHAVGEMLRLEAEAASLLIAYQSAITESERRDILVDYLRNRADDPIVFSRDVKAVRQRWLDVAALQERIAVDRSDRLDEVEVAYRAVRSLAAKSDPGDVATVLEDASSISTVLEHAEPDRPNAVRRAALQAATALLGALGRKSPLHDVGIEAARKVSAWARGDGADRWVQIAALDLALVLFGAEMLPIARELLNERTGPDGSVIGQSAPADGMVVRRNALRIAAACSPGADALATLLLARDDPSEHVRQGLAVALAKMGQPASIAALEALCLEDESPRVRGVAIRELAGAALCYDAARGPALDVVKSALAEADPLVARVALDAISTLSTGAIVAVPPDAFVEALALLANRDDARPELSEQASALLQRLDVDCSKERGSLKILLSSALAELLEGESITIDVPTSTTERDLERALLVAARGDMTVSLRRLAPHRFVLVRGEPRRVRAWRLLNEMKKPMPDKRKGGVHTHGRVFTGEIVVPPIGMAEVTPTRVPGERQLVAQIGGWGPFLPRVDDLIATSSLARRTVRLVTSIGVVVLSGPARLRDRLRARWRLTLAYEQWVQARERSLGADEPSTRRAYAQMAEGLGFSLRMEPSAGEVLGAEYSIRSFLPTHFYGIGFPVGAFDNPLSYFLSPTGNTPTHLALLAWLIFAFLVLQAAWIMRGIEKARAAIPLCIGGWGTRGKSGSERLKAALFHALRYDVVVKTTGCEAMFIHAMRDMPAQEIFLHRPYDKATIWEQRNVLHYAARLRAQVFLWECMALQPRFVDTLVGEWMSSRITTITNAYPDHEDIQGPSGEDVARVIGRFSARQGVTFTTEEQMLPLLKDAATKHGSELRVVPPLEADLLPSDLLARMPYEEHPRNIAMVLALAEHLGIDREYALVEMADHVVLDLGVLKTYPSVTHRGRRLTFSNGMSANERAGFLSCWLRLEFDKMDIDREPHRATVLVVNNRGDRVARSRVFAQILVEDVAVDHIVMIGTNLGGLYQFTLDALDARLPEMRVTGEGGTQRALARFDEAMRRLKVIRREEDVRRASTEDEAWTQAERQDFATHVERLLRRKQAAEEARREIGELVNAGRLDQADDAFRRVYRTLFIDRIAVLWNSAATGDKVIDFIASQIAPGRDARVMGCQNIKGTGLDFVYRWLSIDRVRTALEKMASVPTTRAEILNWMSSYSDFGLIDCREALSFLERVAEEEEWAPHRNVVTSVAAKLSALEDEKIKKLDSIGKAGHGQRVLTNVEQLVDHLDSVRSRRRAKAIMEDVFSGRVSHDRAALLFRELTARQKGGWLAKELAALWVRVGSRIRRS